MDISFVLRLEGLLECWPQKKRQVDRELQRLIKAKRAGIQFISEEAVEVTGIHYVQSIDGAIRFAKEIAEITRKPFGVSFHVDADGCSAVISGGKDAAFGGDPIKTIIQSVIAEVVGD